MKKLSEKQLDLERRHSVLKNEVNRVKGTINYIKGNLSQVMKLATETDSKLEFIIDVKLLETVKQRKKTMQKIGCCK